LASRVKDIEKSHLLVDEALFPIGICYPEATKSDRRYGEKTEQLTFDSRVVIDHELIANELYGDSRLSDT
jgi:hypothetical protein